MTMMYIYDLKPFNMFIDLYVHLLQIPAPANIQMPRETTAGKLLKKNLMMGKA